jgi:hypothetical protein
MIGTLGSTAPDAWTLVVEVNDAPGPSDASPKQSANAPASGTGKVDESKHSLSPSDVVAPESVTFGASLMKPTMYSPLHAVVPALSVVAVHCPDAQDIEICRLQGGCWARAGRVRRERKVRMTAERKKEPPGTRNVEC